MRNYIKSGSVMTVTASGAVSSGDVVETGSLVGVAATDAASGEQVEVALEGVYEVPKVSAQAWTQGVAVYWDSSAGNATTSSSGNTLMGHAFEAAENPSATGRVLLSR